jgi:hypothetical protein
MGDLKIPEIRWWCEGRFLFLECRGYKIKLEARPQISAEGVHFDLYMVSPDLREETSPSEAFETLKEIREAFGFQYILSMGKEVVLVGEKADLHVICRSEKVVKQTDDGYFIVYRPKFALELRYK